jgi:pantoate--beta-alanine ligase
MGYLHEGHFSLVRRSREENDLTVVTLFVNPTQFGPKEDLARYPRDFERDRANLEGLGVDALYAPDARDMYGSGGETWVVNRGSSEILCGRTRAGHFDGVLTVVLKLFQRVGPARAYFGKKDFQQFTLIRRMALELDLPVEVFGLPTIRLPSGLALSSRNTYLTPAELERAPAMHRTLTELRRLALCNGETRVDALTRWGIEALEQASFKVDYLEIRSAETLATVSVAGPGCVALTAAFLGTTRLIDNLEF